METNNLSSNIINYIIVTSIIFVIIRVLYFKIKEIKENREIKKMMDKDIYANKKNKFNEEFTFYYSKIMFLIPMLKVKNKNQEHIDIFEAVLSNIFKDFSILNGEENNIKKFDFKSKVIIINLKELLDSIEKISNLKLQIKE